MKHSQFDGRWLGKLRTQFWEGPGVSACLFVFNVLAYRLPFSPERWFEFYRHAPGCLSFVIVLVWVEMGFLER